MTGNVSPYVDGDTVTFTCVVTGGIPTPTVQWLQNNANLNGETMTTLSFVAAQSSAGDYTCTATNSVGSLTSSAETLVMHGKLFVFRNKESTHSITFFSYFQRASWSSDHNGQLQPLWSRGNYRPDLCSHWGKPCTNNTMAQEWSFFE